MIKSKKKLLVVICLFAGTSLFAQQGKKNLNIVFIGNSITAGTALDSPEVTAPPVAAAAYLRQQANIGKVEFSNQGRSGFTTVDFLPTSHDAFTRVEQAAKAFADKQALLIFSVKLGTNDSAVHGPNGSPVSPENYRQNLKIIADSLLKEFPGSIIIFQHPLWYSPTTYNSAEYLQEGLDRLQSYIPVIDQLIDDYAVTQPHRVFKGDTKAFKYFKENYLTDFKIEEGRRGKFYLHPNKKGSVALGNFWGTAINKVVKKLK